MSTSVQYRSFRSLSCFLAVGGLLACQSSPASEGELGSQAKPVEKSFPLQLPASYQSVALRGEGSEFLKAPVGAKVLEVADEFVLSAGSGFALRIRPVAPSLQTLTARWSKEQVVYRADDAVIVKNSKGNVQGEDDGGGGGYGLVVVRQLIPEWDESDRRQYSCSTPGMLTIGAPLTTFSAVKVGAMLAACRSLRLPVLE